MAYNWIFKELVKGPDDVSGALAYVLYKNEKVAYIERFTADQGRDPTEADLAEFHRMTNLPGRLDAYRSQADDLLETFLDNVLTTELLTYKQEVKDDATVKAVKTSFVSGVVQNVVAGLFTTLMTFGAVLAVWMYSEGPENILKGAYQRYMNGGAPPPPSAPPQQQAAPH
jgi:hypothetical protein